MKVVVFFMISIMSFSSYAISSCDKLDVDDEGFSSCIENEVLNVAVDSLRLSKLDFEEREVASIGDTEIYDGDLN